MAASVAVVGLGRVGLPLALSFADRGLDVIGVEREAAVLDQLAAGPDAVPARPARRSCSSACCRAAGFELHPSGPGRRARPTTSCSRSARPRYVHIEIDISQIRGVIDDLLPVLREGHSLILRSTVAPGTTEWVAGYIEQRRGFQRRRGPVRRRTCPSGSPRTTSSRRSRRCRASSAASARAPARAPPSCSRCSAPRSCRPRPVQAELAKIWTNILRYTQFALPNLLMMECEQYGANVFDVIDLINHDYPRGGIGAPGLTAGTCLRKDFTFSEERSSAPGMLLAVSRVHETRAAVPRQGAASRGSAARCATCKVAVLGLTFKRDSDDVRDSLSYKLIRMLERELAHVARHDPHVPGESEPLEAALEGADAVVVATNHSEFEGLLERLPEGTLLVDPWNVTGSGRVFGVVHERAIAE